MVDLLWAFLAVYGLLLVWVGVASLRSSGSAGDRDTAPGYLDRLAARDAEALRVLRAGVVSRCPGKPVCACADRFADEVRS